MRLDTAIVPADMAQQCKEIGVHFAGEEFGNFQDAGGARCEWTRGTFEGDSLPVRRLQADDTAHEFRVALAELLSHGRSLTVTVGEDGTAWASCENSHDGPLRPSYKGGDAAEAVFACVKEEIDYLYYACEQIMDDAAAAEWERLWDGVAAQ